MKLMDQIRFLKQGDFKTLCRSISLVENEVPGYEDLLKQLKPSSAKIIGVSGASCTGKNKLSVDATKPDFNMYHFAEKYI